MNKYDPRPIDTSDVAVGEGLGAVACGEAFERCGGLVAAVLRWVGIDRRVVEQVALRVEDDDLASGAVSGVEGDHALLPEG